VKIFTTKRKTIDCFSESIDWFQK